MAYKISSDDPDIILMKEMFGKELDVFHPRHKRTHIPGSEPLKWDQLDVFSGSLWTGYLNHCGAHCKYLLKWQGSNFDEVIQLIPKLKEKSRGDIDLARILNVTLNTMNFFEDGPVGNSEIELAEMLGITPMELALSESSSAWSALAEYCIEKKILAEVTKKITSDAKVKKHHFLAAVAAHLTKYVSEHFRASNLSRPTRFLPLIFTLIQDAERAQTLDKAGENDKKRQVKSPDQFLMHELAKKNNNEPYLTREMMKLVFLKGWLYHYTSGEREYEQFQLIQTIIGELKPYKDAKTISGWLTKIKKPGALLADYKNEEPVSEPE